MAFHQVVVTATPRDAVSNSAFAIREVLRQLGPSEIFAMNIDEALRDEVHPLAQFDAFAAGDRRAVLIFHVSIGAPDVFEFVHTRTEPLVVVYHNVSPADAFRPFDPHFAGLLEAGRRELSRLSSRTTMALTPSRYNAEELVGAGFDDVRVWPLIVDGERLRHVTPDAVMAKHLTDEVDGPVLLFVGQVLPHKRPDLLLEAFHLYVTHMRPDARLYLVGASRLPRYHECLTELMADLNMPSASILSSIPDEELVAFFQRADVFVTASEHEGFCVPLLESMAFDVPVVARAYGAIPETLGGAGLVLPPGSGPALLAEAINEVVENSALREAMVKHGRARLDDFDAEQTRRRLLDHLLEVA